jgi:hypothetical protein
MTLPALTSTEVLVAGVPWPRHKLFAVLAGLLTLVVVGVVTTSAAPAVLGGAAVGVAVALALRSLARQRD